MSEKKKEVLEMPQFFSIEKEIDGKKCHFFMQAGVNLGAAYDFAFSVLNYIMEMSKEATKKAEQTKKEEVEPKDRPEAK